MAYGFDSRDEILGRAAANRRPPLATAPTPTAGVTRPPLASAANGAKLMRGGISLPALGATALSIAAPYAYGAAKDVAQVNPETFTPGATMTPGARKGTLRPSLQSADIAARPPEQVQATNAAIAAAPPAPTMQPAADPLYTSTPINRPDIGGGIAGVGTSEGGVVAPAQPIAVQPKVEPGVTAADQQAQLARNAADKAQLAGIERQQDINVLRQGAAAPLNLSGGIGDLVASKNAQRIAKAELQSALQTQGQEKLLDKRQAFEQPLQEAQIGLAKQGIAKGAQDVADKVKLANLRQQLIDAKTPEERKRIEGMLYAAQGKPETKSRIISEKGVGPDGITPTQTSYIVEEGTDGREIARPLTGIGAQGGQQKTKGAISTVNGKTAMWDGAKWVPQ